jgi:hypothetical protein
MYFLSGIKNASTEAGKVSIKTVAYQQGVVQTSSSPPGRQGLSPREKTSPILTNPAQIRIVRRLSNHGMQEQLFWPIQHKH